MIEVEFSDVYLPPFEGFKKMPRLYRDCWITEKIDGTNAQIYIAGDGGFYVGSKNRWITPDSDNYGFAKWAYAHQEELMELGVGHHYGEWWGQGIQRNYGLKEKRFSLFNVYRWLVSETPPACCSVVPVLYYGLFSTKIVDDIKDDLRVHGSEAVDGWMKPEGIVVYHEAGNQYFKSTLENDEKPKGKSE